jgi:hypothetical protein
MQAKLKPVVSAVRNNIVKLDTMTAITNIGNLMLAVARAPEAIQTEVDKLRKAKVKMGTVKQNCALALRFQKIFDEGKHASGKPISPATRDNYLAALRKAINEGTKFLFNPYLAASRAKAQAKKVAARPADTSAPASATSATPSTPTSATSAPASTAPSTPTSATSAPASTAPSTPTSATPSAPVAPAQANRLKVPEAALREIGRALCAVRAECTQSTWKAVLILNPALAKLVDTWGDTWVLATPAPVAPAPAKATRKAAK